MPMQSSEVFWRIVMARWDAEDYMDWVWARLWFGFEIPNVTHWRFPG